MVDALNKIAIELETTNNILTALGEVSIDLYGAILDLGVKVDALQIRTQPAAPVEVKKPAELPPEFKSFSFEKLKEKVK
jgi:hypothetical protein